LSVAGINGYFMKQPIAIGLACCALLGCQTTDHRSSELAGSKEDPPRTVRRELGVVTIDGKPARAYIYEVGKRTVAVELIIAQRVPGPRMDSARFSAALRLKDGGKVNATFHLSPRVPDAIDDNERQVAEFGYNLRLHDIRWVILYTGGQKHAFK